MNSLVDQYSKQIGFFMVAAAILLFMPFVQTIVMSGFVAIFESEKLSFTAYLEVVGGHLVYGYVLHIPAIVLLFLGIRRLKRK